MFVELSWAHMFVSSVGGALKKQTKALITGGNYAHTFVSATSGGIEKANDYVQIVIVPLFFVHCFEYFG